MLQHPEYGINLVGFLDADGNALVFFQATDFDGDDRSDVLLRLTNGSDSYLALLLSDDSGTLGSGSGPYSDGSTSAPPPTISPSSPPTRRSACGRTASSSRG